MIIRQTQTLIFEYPDEYQQEYEWCKTKDDRWFHKGRDTNCSIYEIVTDFIITQSEQTEPNSSEKPNNCETEPQTERIKTLDYCDICNHKGCDNCIANNLDDYCVPSGYEPITQTETQNSNLTFEKDECAKEYEELGLKELKELIKADRNSSEIPNNCDTCRNKGFEGCEQPCLGCGCCGLYEPKDEPQTDCAWK